MYQTINFMIAPLLSYYLVSIPTVTCALLFVKQMLLISCWFEPILDDVTVTMIDILMLLSRHSAH